MIVKAYDGNIYSYNGTRIVEECCSGETMYLLLITDLDGSQYEAYKSRSKENCRSLSDKLFLLAGQRQIIYSIPTWWNENGCIDPAADKLEEHRNQTA